MEDQEYFYNLYNSPNNNIQPYSSLDAPPPCSQGVRTKITFGQSIVHEFCKRLAKDDRRGLLVLHSTGSGKTCAASGIMDAFRGAERNIVYVSSVAGIKSNPISKFEACAKDFFKNVDSSRVLFMSFAQLEHTINNNSTLNDKRRAFIRKSVLIIDEVHKLFHPIDTQVKEHNNLKEFLLGNDGKEKDYDMKIIIMTATPGDDPDEVVQLLNIIRDRRNPPFAVPDFTNDTAMYQFTKSILGMVSFIDMSKDIRLFPRVIEDDIEAAMSPDHYKTYEEKLRKTVDAEKTFNPSKSEQYMRMARKYSNSLFKYTPEREIVEFSSKMAKLIDQIAAYPGEKHYVYSAFYENKGSGGHGVRAIGMFLENMGYSQFKVEDTTKEISKKKRFIYLINNEIAGPNQTESKQAENVQKLIDIFNSDNNRNGDYISVILASQGYNESVDLASVRHIHVLEPLVSYGKYIQLKGRAVRYCSHQQIADKFGQWTVFVHNYLSKGPPDPLQFININNIVKRIDVLDVLIYHGSDLQSERQELIEDYNMAVKSVMSNRDTIDNKIREDAKLRYMMMEKMQQALIVAAIDCRLTAKYHNHGLKCFS